MSDFKIKLSNYKITIQYIWMLFVSFKITKKLYNYNDFSIMSLFYGGKQQPPRGAAGLKLMLHGDKNDNNNNKTRKNSSSNTAEW